MLFQGEGWIGHITTMAPTWARGAEDLTARNRRYFGRLRERGRVMTNQHPEDFYWDVEFRDPLVETYYGGGIIDFSDSDLYRQLRIGTRGYISQDAMTEEERLQQNGDAAILKRYDRKIPALLSAMEKNASAELYIDGSAAGNGRRYEGLETFMGAGTCATDDIICQPNGAYGGKDTDLGGEGGSWSTALTTKPNSTIATDWPYGQGDAEYDYMAPKMLNWSSTGWGTGGTSFEDNCERAVRALAIWCTHGNGPENRPSEIILSADLYNSYLNHMASKGRTIIPIAANTDYGMNAQRWNGIMQEGWQIIHDYDCPAGKGYAVNYDKMALMLLGSQLFMPDGPRWVPERRSYIFSVASYGNLRYWSPKHFGKLQAFA